MNLDNKLQAAISVIDRRAEDFLMAVASGNLDDPRLVRMRAEYDQRLAELEDQEPERWDGMS